MKKLMLIMMPILALSCSKGNPTAPKEVAEAPEETILGNTYMKIIGGDNQVGTVGTVLAEPCSVRAMAKDQYEAEHPVVGVLVNFAVIKGGGSAWAGSALTDSLGYASDFWTLGPLAGQQKMQVRSILDGKRTVFGQFRATAEPGPPDSVWIAGPPGKITWGMFVGETLDLKGVVGVFDRYGNDIPFRVEGDPGFGISETILAPTGIVFSPISIVADDSTVAAIEFGSFLDPRNLGLVGDFKYYKQSETRKGIRDSIWMKQEKVAGTWAVTPARSGLTWISGNRRSMLSNEYWTRISWYRNGTVDTSYSLESGIQFQSIAPTSSLLPDTLKWSSSNTLFVRTSKTTWEPIPAHSNPAIASLIVRTTAVPPR